MNIDTETNTYLAGTENGGVFKCNLPSLATKKLKGFFQKQGIWLSH
jgi:hypothetical protein